MRLPLVLLASALLALPGSGFAQALRAAPETLGNAPSANRLPNGSPAHTTMRAVQLLRPAELVSVPASSLLHSVGFALARNTDVPTSGQAKIYLQNTADETLTKSTTWSAAIADMTLVYEGSYGLPVGDAPATIDVPIATPFPFTGGGLYVAVDYLGSTFTDVAGRAEYDCNLDLQLGVINASSTTTTPPAVLGNSGAFRARTRLRFTVGLARSCSAEDECASGQCVDGVCCDTACTGDCDACSIAAGAATDGTCGPVPDGTSCDDANVCTQTDTCHAGICVGADPLVCEPAQCQRADSCDPSQGCQFAPNQGASCRAASCADGVATEPATCDVAGSCPALRTVSCAPYTCDAAGSACLGRCTRDTECVGAAICNADGACAVPRDAGESGSSSGTSSSSSSSGTADTDRNEDEEGGCSLGAKGRGPVAPLGLTLVALLAARAARRRNAVQPR